jgi:hypothetical protein
LGEIQPMLPSQLLHRFEGCLLGAGLGEWWAMPAAALTSTLDLPLAQLTQQTTVALLGGGAENADRPPIANTLTAAVALLPIFLCTHESGLKRLQRLQLLALWEAPQISQAGLWLIGSALGQACQGRTAAPANQFDILIEECFQCPGAPSFNDDWQSGLAQVRALLRQPSALRLAQGLTALPIEQRSLCQVLYAFLATPTTPAIAVARLRQMVGLSSRAETLARSDRQSSAAALVGALAGAYNGSLGLPIGAQIACQAHPLLNAAALSPLATGLFQSWSGQYQLSSPGPFVTALSH